MDFWFLAVSVASLVVGLVSWGGLWLIYRKLTQRTDELENLMNEVGDQVGAYIDAMEE